MPPLKNALIPPANIGDWIQPASAPLLPPVAPREQAGLATGSLGPAPSIWTTDYDRVRQFNRPGTSQQRLPPLPVKSNPQVNSAARSVAAQVVASSPAAENVSIFLTMPASEFSVAGSPSGSTGGFAVTKNPQLFGEVWATPPGSSAISTYLDTEVTGSAAATSITLTAVATQTQDLAIVATQGGFIHGGGMTVPSGFTSISLFGTNVLAMKLVPSGLVSVTSTYSDISPAMASVLALFPYTGTSLPTVSLVGTTGGANGGSFTVGGNVPAGTTFLLGISGGGELTNGAVTGTSLTDTSGNHWIKIGEAVTTAGDSAFVSVWFCLNPVIASGVSFTATYSTGFAGGGFSVYAGTGTISQAKAIPTFLPASEFLSAGGVSSLNSLTGPLTLVAGSGVTINPSGSTITIGATGGGGGSFPAALINVDYPPATATAWDDEFTGTSLNSKWSLNNSMAWAGNSTGYTNVYAPTYDQSALLSTLTATSSVMAAVQPISGLSAPFQVSAKLFLQGAGNYTGCYLFIADSAQSNAVRIAYEWNNGAGITEMTCGYGHINSGTVTFWEGSNALAQYNNRVYSETVYLHLQANSGGSWSGYISYNGRTWICLFRKSTIVSFTPAYIGFGFANNGYSPASFGGAQNWPQFGIDWFRVNYIPGMS